MWSTWAGDRRPAPSDQEFAALLAEATRRAQEADTAA